MTVTAEISTGKLAELVKQVQAGNEVLLTHGNKPVAKLIAAVEQSAPKSALEIRCLKGHRVLTPVIRQDHLAEEMFSFDRRLRRLEINHPLNSPGPATEPQEFPAFPTE